MSIVSEIVSRLIASGTPPEVAAVAVAEAFAAGMSAGKSADSPVDKSAEKRRAYDRDRKREERERLRKSGGNPVEVRGSPENASSLSNKDSEIEKKKEKKRAQKLPQDWQPNEKHLRQAIELGQNRAWMAEQFEDMRLWARANEHRAVARKLEWDLTFTTWMRRNASKRNGQPQRSMTAAELLKTYNEEPDVKPADDELGFDLDLRANPTH